MTDSLLSSPVTGRQRFTVLAGQPLVEPARGASLPNGSFRANSHEIFAEARLVGRTIRDYGDYIDIGQPSSVLQAVRTGFNETPSSDDPNQPQLHINPAAPDHRAAVSAILPQVNHLLVLPGSTETAEQALFALNEMKNNPAYRQTRMTFINTARMQNGMRTLIGAMFFNNFERQQDHPRLFLLESAQDLPELLASNYTAPNYFQPGLKV